MKAIFANDLAGGFGNKGGLPWPSIPEDFKHFAAKTAGCYIIMGGNTWNTLPDLPGRVPVVVSSKVPQGSLWVPSSILLDELKDYWAAQDDAFLIGGAKLLVPQNLDLCTHIYHTTVKDVYYSCDTYIHEDTLCYLKTLAETIIYQDDKIIIREYINEKLLKPNT